MRRNIRVIIIALHLVYASSTIRAFLEQIIFIE
jgi:hypothetical protein